MGWTMAGPRFRVRQGSGMATVRRGSAGGLAVLCVLVMAGCGAVPGAGGRDRLHEQADQALARYDRAARAAAAEGFVPVGELTGQLGDWEPEVGDNDKIALLSGNLEAVVALPPAPSTTGQVVWPDGTTHPVTLLSAQEALVQLVTTAGSTDCGGCTTLQVTGAELIERPVATSRGTAQAPVWAFSLRGTKVRATRLAVRPEQTVTVTPPPWDPNDPPGGIPVDSATLAPDGITVTVSFVGSPGPASQPCGADYTAEPVESDTAVVVIVEEHRAGGEQACTAVGASRTAVATLSRPLGSRAVLEVVQGTPVSVTAD